VTKCNPDISEETKNSLIKEIKPLARQQLYFTTFEYGQLYHINTGQMMNPPAHTEVLLVTGIANPSPLKKLLEERSNGYHLLQYPDHHVFSIDDLVEIHKKFDKIETAEKIILTTEKDAVRLKKFSAEISGLPFYVIPVRHRFLFNDDQKFLQQVSSFITDFRQQS
jgi:tetraacyldisaccharide 4'-kinase